MTVNSDKVRTIVRVASIWRGVKFIFQICRVLPAGWRMRSRHRGMRSTETRSNEKFEFLAMTDTPNGESYLTLDTRSEVMVARGSDGNSGLQIALALN